MRVWCPRRASFAVVIDFETLADSESVTTQFASSGVNFSNAIALTAGLSLNELEFPPHSGTTVVTDAGGGPLTILFGPNLFLDVGGFFTYLTPLTLHAFDASDILVGTASSAFSSNIALNGDPGSAPNEFLQITSVIPIARLEIVGDPLGFSFTLDDFTGTPQTAIAEPSALLLLAAGLAGALRYRGHSHRKRHG